MGKTEITEAQEQTVYDCVREMLWIARVWNDHNFTPGVIRGKAKAVADALGCNTVEQCNELLDLLQAKLEE